MSFCVPRLSAISPSNLEKLPGMPTNNRLRYVFSPQNVLFYPSVKPISLPRRAYLRGLGSSMMFRGVSKKSETLFSKHNSKFFYGYDFFWTPLGTGETFCPKKSPETLSFGGSDF